MQTTSNLWFRGLVLIAATVWSLPSRADIAPTCGAFDALITCDAKDVGKACQGGGQCYAVSCGTGMTVYKCDACPAILSAPDAGCEPSKFGTACGDGGMCSSTRPTATPRRPNTSAPGPRQPDRPDHPRVKTAARAAALAWVAAAAWVAEARLEGPGSGTAVAARQEVRAAAAVAPRRCGRQQRRRRRRLSVLREQAVVTSRHA